MVRGKCLSSEPYGSFYDSFGDPVFRHEGTYQEPSRWIHKHYDTIFNHSNASEGIICANEAGTWNNYNNEFAVGQTSNFGTVLK